MPELPKLNQDKRQDSCWLDPDSERVAAKCEFWLLPLEPNGSIKSEKKALSFTLLLLPKLLFLYTIILLFILD